MTCISFCVIGALSIYMNELKWMEGGNHTQLEWQSVLFSLGANIIGYITISAVYIKK